MTPSTVTVLPAVTKQARYDAAKDSRRDHPGRRHLQRAGGASDVPAKTLHELIALAKAKPGTLNYASAGAGSSPHMSMELLKHMAGIDLQHIPFKGTGPAMTEVLSGRIAALFSNMLTGKPLIEAGKLRALAVSGPQAGGGDAGRADRRRGRRAGLFGAAMVRPAGARRHAATDRRQAAGRRGGDAAPPDVRERLAQDGAEPVGGTSAEFAALIKADLDKWSTIAKAANIQAE